MRPATASALRAAIALAVVGGFGLFVHQPWLFPSLGPTLLMRAQTPEPPNSRAWNAFMGHVIGALAGSASVLMLAAQDLPGVLGSGHLTPRRLAAACLALALTTVAGRAARATHPPAASTTLLFAEGSYHPGWHDIFLVVAGTALSVVTGELLR
jgi:hypothetical protein